MSDIDYGLLCSDLSGFQFFLAFFLMFVLAFASVTVGEVYMAKNGNSHEWAEDCLVCKYFRSSENGN